MIIGMPVILIMRDSDSYRLDRRFSQDEIAKRVNDNRGSGKLVDFELDLTPTGQKVWLDCDEVVAVQRRA